MSTTTPQYEYRRAPELDAPGPQRGVVVVGAGPVGLTAAIDLAQRGMPVLVLDDDDTVSVGSRAICYSKRTLEILDRLGCGEPIAAKGVGWKVGKVYQGNELAYQFDLLPEAGHRRPAFVNLQQYHFEEALVRRARALPALELRWRHRVTSVTCTADRVTLAVATEDGDYALTCDWLVVCDGARSPIRHMLGLDFEGQVFRDRFLIADIRMTSDFPAERRFWFDPPFHPNQSVLLHRQPDDIWRVDFQLGWDADPELEKKPERILPRLRAMLGADARFEIEWASVYTFQCRRMQKFRHGRLLFAGDAAHLVSPFGARGANSGIQDVDNLAWKLALVMGGQADAALLDTYDDERVAAADENLRNSTRSTDFITPKSADVAHVPRRGAVARAPASVRAPARQQRTAVGPRGARGLAAQHAGRRRVRRRDGAGRRRRRRAGHGAARRVAARSPGRRLHAARVRRPRRAGGGAGAGRRADSLPIVQVGGAAPDGRDVVGDPEGLVAARYDGRVGTCYLFRPDQHVCARWRAFDANAVRTALARATGHVEEAR